MEAPYLLKALQMNISATKKDPNFSLNHTVQNRKKESFFFIFYFFVCLQTVAPFKGELFFSPHVTEQFVYYVTLAWALPLEDYGGPLNGSCCCTTTLLLVHLVHICLNPHRGPFLCSLGIIMSFVYVKWCTMLYIRPFESYKQYITPDVSISL